MRRRRNEGFLRALCEGLRSWLGAREALATPPRIEPYLGAAKPACPRCSRPMLKQIAKQGSHAGKSFWGCPAFPDCRGTLPTG
jgi:ssDNA-binding Zn-finger/Zn-ribbon topoisomerase 1